MTLRNSSASILDNVLCGWRVRSELALPELAPWTGADAPPDIVIRLGAVPERLDHVVMHSPILQIDEDRRCLFSLGRVGRYLLADDREIVIAPAAGATEADIRLFLLGTMFGLLCHKRGLYPLHASSIRIGDGAVAFVGSSGAGKSTIAATFATRGYAPLADDVCVIDASGDGGPAVLPAFPRLKLWRDCLKALDIDPDGLIPVRPNLQKYNLLLSAEWRSDAVPLKAIMFLKYVHVGSPESCERIKRPVALLQSLRREVYRAKFASALGVENVLFRSETRIAANVPAYSLRRQKDFALQDELIQRILKLLAA